MIVGPSPAAMSLPQLRIVIGAMVFGIASFAVVVLVVGRTMTPDPSLTWVFCGVLGFLAVTEMPAYLVVRAGLVRTARSRYEQSGGGQDAGARVAQSFFTLSLIRAAMAEGFGLAGLVFLLLTGFAPLWLAPIISLALLIFGMPTQSKLDEFVREVIGSNPFAS